MSYHRHSDIIPYAGLTRGPASQCTGNLPAETELEAWVLSKGKEDLVRVRYYQMLQVHLRVDMSECSQGGHDSRPGQS